MSGVGAALLEPADVLRDDVELERVEAGRVGGAFSSKRERDALAGRERRAGAAAAVALETSAPASS